METRRAEKMRQSNALRSPPLASPRDFAQHACRHANAGEVLPHLRGRMRAGGRKRWPECRVVSDAARLPLGGRRVVDAVRRGALALGGRSACSIRCVYRSLSSWGSGSGSKGWRRRESGGAELPCGLWAHRLRVGPEAHAVRRTPGPRPAKDGV